MLKSACFHSVLPLKVLRVQNLKSEKPRGLTKQTVVVNHDIWRELNVIYEAGPIISQLRPKQADDMLKMTSLIKAIR